MNQKLNDLQELSDRVLNLHRRVCGARSNICDANSPLAPNNPGLYSSDTGDQQQNSIQITPAQIEFYDENWRDVIEHFKSNDKILCYQTLIDTLDKQLLSKQI